MPFGVTLALDQGSYQPYIYIDGPTLASIDSSDHSSDILACLAPQVNHVDSTYTILENILLHFFFGIKFFHIYGNGLTNKFIQTLSQPHQKLSFLNVNILPWNVPDEIHPSITRNLVEMDCHMRAKSRGFQSNFVVVLCLSVNFCMPNSIDIFSPSEYYSNSCAKVWSSKCDRSIATVSKTRPTFDRCFEVLSRISRNIFRQWHQINNSLAPNDFQH